MEHRISQQFIFDAHSRIIPHIHRTPIITSHTLNDILGCNVYFKCENLQKIGAFKIRGAMNSVLLLTESEKANGVATHSSGNHAQALAFAARQLGISAHIVMPRTSPPQKAAAVRGYGGQITFCEPNLAAREQTLAEIVKQTGATEIHPFDNDNVITGQATCAKEMFEDTSTPIDILFAPVGGGGLLSGTGISAHYFSNSTKVIGCEPEGAADAIRSFASGNIETAPFIETIADGLLTTLSARTLGYIRTYVSEILLASEANIRRAMKFYSERMKIVVEPSGAVPLAVLFQHYEKFVGKNIGIIISGGNIDLLKISDWIREAE